MKKKQFITALLVLLCTMVIFTTCELDVAETVQDVALTDPYISKQPASQSMLVGEAADPLTIEVRDWSSDEGNLTLQWYTFAALDDFVKGSVTPVGTASAGTTVTINDGNNTVTSWTFTVPADHKKAAGDRNYYYAVLTNRNSSVNVGKDTGTVQSEVAVIAYSDPDGARAPIISRHPGSAEYQAGRSINFLTVRAIPGSAEAALSYQWWTFTLATDGTITNRAPVPGATLSTFEPDPATLKFGKNYFYVVVTSTEGTGGDVKTATETSTTAVIEIKAGVRALAPNITVQPRDKMYFAGDSLAKLTATAVSRDAGLISYQWYENDKHAIIPDGAQKSTATPITGATSSEFEAPIPTAAAPTKYYYAVVTNTQAAAEEEKTASVNTKVVKVSFATPDMTTPPNAVVTVADPKKPENRYQYVRGYGGMDVAWANFPEQKPEDMEEMYNPDKLGYNINRVMISPGKVDPIEGIQDLLNNHRPNYYENVKIVNKYGGYNLASPWSPPKEWKSNNSINGGGHLLYAYRQQFADYLKRFAQNMYDNGAPIYAISISNEPNYTAGYDGCEWTPAEMRDFYKQVGRFTEGVRGYGGGKQTPVVLTVNGESANNPDINIAALQDPVSRAAIDLLCRHVYGNQTVTLWRHGVNGATLSPTTPDDSTIPSILNRPDGTKYEVWMTEHNINSANATAYPSDSTWNYVWRYMNDVDLVMRLNNENAFVWWASKRFYSMIGDGSYNTVDGAVLPRGWGLSHYAKYTNDTHRIRADVTGVTGDGAAITFEANGSNVNNRSFSLDNASARITAYASIASGKENAPINDAADDVEFISLVMWTPTDTSGRGGVDMGTIEIRMPTGFIIGSYTAIKSVSARREEVHQPYEVTVSGNRDAAYVDLASGQMLSVKFIKGN